jgi:Ras-related protein Rab-6A
MTQFLYRAFDNKYQATVGIDFVCKVLALPDRSVKLQLWDTAGQERFRSLIPSYLRETAGCVVVYDVTDRKSFDSVEFWVNAVKRERQDVVIALVGNKQDVEASKREVSEAQGDQLAKRLELAIFKETSAKTGRHVHEVFKGVAMALPNPTARKNPVEDFQSQSSSAPWSTKIKLSAGIYKQRVLDVTSSANNCC